MTPLYGRAPRGERVVDYGMRPHLKMSDTSSRLDETYVKVGKEWKYLYRAVDSAGDAIEFMLSAKRDIPAAKCFFRKLMRANHQRLPFTSGTDPMSQPYNYLFKLVYGELT